MINSFKQRVYRRVLEKIAGKYDYINIDQTAPAFVAERDDIRNKNRILGSIISGIGFGAAGGAGGNHLGNLFKKPKAALGTGIVSTAGLLSGLGIAHKADQHYGEAAASRQLKERLQEAIHKQSLEYIKDNAGREGAKYHH